MVVYKAGCGLVLNVRLSAEITGLTTEMLVVHYFSGKKIAQRRKVIFKLFAISIKPFFRF